MEFLKSAVASAISKGPPFPYSFGDRVDIDSTIWTLYNGTKKEDGSRCSIFSFDVAQHPSRLPLAQNAAQKLKTLRHPGVLKVLDTAESDRYVYIATERVTPLSWHVRRQSMSSDTIAWGLRLVVGAVKFLNENGYVHGNIRLPSIYTTESGEWRVGGFEALSLAKEYNEVIYSHASLVPDLTRFAPPEVVNNGWDVLKQNPITAIDAYGLGLLIAEIFNNGITSVTQLSSIQTIPANILPHQKRLVVHNPKSRLSADGFLQIGNRPNGFFRNPLVELTDSLEQLDLQDSETKQSVMSDLCKHADTLQEDFLRHKILPILLKQAEFGEHQCLALSTVMQMEGKFQDDDWETIINPVIVRLFGLPDRRLRLTLLQFFPQIIEHLTQRVVSNQIFPQWATGFNDAEALMREETLKSVLSIIPKLNERIANGDLLRCLGKTANDPQEGIRTNTTICLGKIARNLSEGTRNRVLVVAFTRSLRDPYIHARKAALLAIAATSDLFNEVDCASKLLPAICPSLIDRDKLVRDQASKTFDSILSRVRRYSETLPEGSTGVPVAGRPAGHMSQQYPSQSQDSSWAGWAISSFASKLVSGAMAVAAVPAEATEPATAPASLGSTPRPRESVPSSSASRQQPFGNPPPITPAASLVEPDVTDTFDAFDPWGDDQPESTLDGATQALEAIPAPTKPKAETKKPAPVPYDDKGEPDFAGWLKAQQTKKPLPAGLKKAPAATRKTGSAAAVMVAKKPTPSTTGTASGSVRSVATGKINSAATTTTAAKKEKEKNTDSPKEENEDDIDAWADWD